MERITKVFFDPLATTKEQVRAILQVRYQDSSVMHTLEVNHLYPNYLQSMPYFTHYYARLFSIEYKKES